MKQKDIKLIKQELDVTYSERTENLNKKLQSLKELLNEDFWKLYDYSSPKEHIEFLKVTKRLQYPKYIDKIEQNGKEKLLIKERNYDHNSADKNAVIESIFLDWLNQKNTQKLGTGSRNGVDFENLGDMEFKTVTHNSHNISLNEKTIIGLIDKADSKMAGNHKIYNEQSKIGLVSGIFKKNTLEPIVVFYIHHEKFQIKTQELLTEKGKELKKIEGQRIILNKKIQDGKLKAGDTFEWGNGTKVLKENQKTLQKPTDNINLRIIDFLDSLQIIFTDEKQKIYFNFNDRLLLKKYKEKLAPYFIVN